MQIKIRLHVVFLLWEEIEIRAEICEKKKKAAYINSRLLMG